MMSRLTKATFPSGNVEVRSSAGRTYTHAWQVFGTKTDGSRYRGRNGWSSSEELARKASQAECVCVPRDVVKPLIVETAPAIEISGKEYRAILAGKKAPVPVQSRIVTVHGENLDLYIPAQADRFLALMGSYGSAAQCEWGKEYLLAEQTVTMAQYDAGAVVAAS